MLKISHAGCPGLSLVISTQFTLEMCVEAWSRKKSLKPIILRVQGRLESSIMMPLISSSPEFAACSCLFITVCTLDKPLTVK